MQAWLHRHTQTNYALIGRSICEDSWLPSYAYWRLAYFHEFVSRLTPICVAPSLSPASVPTTRTQGYAFESGVPKKIPEVANTGIEDC